MSHHGFALTDLAAVSEYTYANDVEADPRWLVAVALHFAEGVLIIEAEPATDQAEMRLQPDAGLQYWAGKSAVADASQRPMWSGLLGAKCVWRWRLTNQQGYADGAQVELSVGRGCTATFQWIAIASRLQAARVNMV
jgi:hypothetical protein